MRSHAQTDVRCRTMRIQLDDTQETLSRLNIRTAALQRIRCESAMQKVASKETKKYEPHTPVRKPQVEMGHRPC